MKVAESVYSISWILLTVAVYDYPLCGLSSWWWEDMQSVPLHTPNPPLHPEAKRCQTYADHVGSPQDLLLKTTWDQPPRRKSGFTQEQCCTLQLHTQKTVLTMDWTVAVPLFDPLWLQNDSKCMSRFLPSKLDSNQRPTTNLSCNLQFTVAPGRWE